MTLPSFNLASKLTSIDGGNFATSTNEILYTSSIVDLLGTDQAFQRIQSGAQASTANVFQKFIEKPYKPLMRKDGDNLIFED